MKRFISAILLFFPALLGCTQNNSKSVEAAKSSLLWKISGNGLEKPSYLFGTIHMLCQEDAILSDSLKKAIRQSDNVYLEVQMDNLLEMIGMLGQLTMRDDTTL